MRKFLLHILAFVLFLAVFLCAGIIASGTFVPTFIAKNIMYRPGLFGHMYSRIKDAQATGNVDILFIGSSLSCRGFDPRIFRQSGYSSFNLGSGSQSHLQSEVLFKQYLESLHPKLVVYEVSPNVFESDGVESGIDIISSDKIDFSVLQMALRLNDIKIYNSLLFAYYKQLINANKNLKAPKEREKSIYIKGGYEERKMLQYNVGSVYPHRNYIFRDTQISAFQRNLQRLKDAHVPYILVQAPNTKDFYSGIENITEIDSFYNASGTYFNFNNVPDFIDTIHFYDRGHLNQKGVALFDGKLIDILKNSNIKF